ncbi:hypothetical protein ACW14Y_23035 [Kitasatospora sp. cg17-2]
MAIKTLRNRIPHLLTAVLLLLGLMTAATTQAQAAPQPLGGSATVCSYSPVPTGWVVTRVVTSSSCTGSGYAYNISDTAGLNSISACSFSTVPTGWVIASASTTSYCSGAAYMYSLTNTAGLSYATACPFSDIPTGWVISSTFSTSYCAGYGFAYNIRRA